MHSEGIPMSGPVIIEEVKPFYVALKITDQCTFL